MSWDAWLCLKMRGTGLSSACQIMQTLGIREMEEEEGINAFFQRRCHLDWNSTRVLFCVPCANIGLEALIQAIIYSHPQSALGALTSMVSLATLRRTLAHTSVL